MNAQVYCPHCNQVVEVSPDMGGEATACPHCRGQFRVPYGPTGGATDYNLYAGGAAPAGPTSPRQQHSYWEAVGIARVACGLVAIFGAWAGLHKFAMGRVVPGLIMLLLTLLSCFLLAPIIWIIGIMEGILYLMQEDGEFFQRYVVEKRGWF